MILDHERIKKKTNIILTMYKVNADEARIYISTVINDKPLIIFFSKLFYFKVTNLFAYIQCS